MPLTAVQNTIKCYNILPCTNSLLVFDLSTTTGASQTKIKCQQKSNLDRKIFYCQSHLHPDSRDDSRDVASGTTQHGQAWCREGGSRKVSSNPSCSQGNEHTQPWALTKEMSATIGVDRCASLGLQIFQGKTTEQVLWKLVLRGTVLFHRCLCTKTEIQGLCRFSFH